MIQEASAIKLFKIETTGDGIERFQTQLNLGRDTFDFIRKDGVMKVYDKGVNGFGFYEYKGSFVIVEHIEEMKKQAL